MQSKGQAICMVGLAMLSGCVQPPPEGKDVLEVAVPQEWSTDDVSASAPQNWVADFGDHRLEGLIEEALDGNFQLQAGLARLDQAVALARIEGSDRWPSLNINGSAQRSTSLMRPEASNSFSLNGAVNWELDLWGRVRAQVRGAEATLLAAESDYLASRLSLANRIAQAWFSAIEARKQEVLSEETVASFEANLQTVEERFRRGLSPALDLRLTRANVANARATLNQQKRIADAAVRSLEALLGRYPSGKLVIGENLPDLNSAIPAGVPADLLNRRPDIVSSFQRLVASDAGLIESKRARLPSINLTGRYGWSSDQLDDLLQDGFDVWALIGNLTAPIFQGGRISANIDRSEARRAEAVANYQNTVLIAFREVEAALAGEALLKEQLAAVSASADESAGAQELAEERYGRGLVNIITVLESQRRAFNAKSAMLRVQKSLLQNRLDLYLALGGGFE